MNNELIKVTTKEGKQLVSGRELHEFLEVKTKFNDWIKGRINKYDFIENTDFIAITEKKVTAQGNETEYTDYILTLSMAKELSMVENNEKGKKARRYFIQCESKLRDNKPVGIFEEMQLRMDRLENNNIKLMEQNNNIMEYLKAEKNFIEASNKIGLSVTKKPNKETKLKYNSNYKKLIFEEELIEIFNKIISTNGIIYEETFAVAVDLESLIKEVENRGYTKRLFNESLKETGLVKLGTSGRVQAKQIRDSKGKRVWNYLFKKEYIK